VTPPFRHQNLPPPQRLRQLFNPSTPFSLSFPPIETPSPLAHEKTTFSSAPAWPRQRYRPPPPLPPTPFPHSSPSPVEMDTTPPFSSGRAKPSPFVPPSSRTQRRRPPIRLSLSFFSLSHLFETGLPHPPSLVADVKQPLPPMNSLKKTRPRPSKKVPQPPLPFPRFFCCVVLFYYWPNFVMRMEMVFLLLWGVPLFFFFLLSPF